MDPRELEVTSGVCLCGCDADERGDLPGLASTHPVLRELYGRLRQAGKPPKLALVALARKLLTLLNAIARERTAWQAWIA